MKLSSEDYMRQNTARPVCNGFFLIPTTKLINQKDQEVNVSTFGPGEGKGKEKNKSHLLV